MVTNDELLRTAMSGQQGSAADRDEALAELLDRLRYGDDPAEYTLPEAVRTTRVDLMCQTCGHTSERGSIDERDKQHLRVDGAHEPGWQDDRADGLGLIRTDLDLIRVLVSQGVPTP